MRNRSSVPLVAFLIVTAVTFGAPAAYAGAPTVSVDPPEGLVDRQTIHVEGSGFTSGAGVSARQCLASDPTRCDPFTAAFPFADASGSFSYDITVRREIRATPNSGVYTDCALVAGGCVIAARNVATPTEFATAPLRFDPKQPALRYEPSVDRKVELRDGGFTVAIAGTMHCTVAFPIGIVGFIGQENGAIRIPGYPFFTFVNCAPDKSGWRTVVTVAPNDRPFLKGKGFVQVIASGTTADPQVATLEDVTLVAR